MTTITSSRPAARAASTERRTTGTPSISARSLWIGPSKRVPAPAARMTAATDGRCSEPVVDIVPVCRTGPGPDVTGVAFGDGHRVRDLDADQCDRTDGAGHDDAGRRLPGRRPQAVRDGGRDHDDRAPAPAHGCRHPHRGAVGPGQHQPCLEARTARRGRPSGDRERKAPGRDRALRGRPAGRDPPTAHPSRYRWRSTSPPCRWWPGAATRSSSRSTRRPTSTGNRASTSAPSDPRRGGRRSVVDRAGGVGERLGVASGATGDDLRHDGDGGLLGSAGTYVEPEG